MEWEGQAAPADGEHINLSTTAGSPHGSKTQSSKAGKLLGQRWSNAASGRAVRAAAHGEADWGEERGERGRPCAQS